jgi:hypothetical protein
VNEFEIEVNPTGTCDIRRDRRHFSYDEDDLDEALYRIRREVGSGVIVDVIESDGYRTTART